LAVIASASGSIGAEFGTGRKALNRGDYATALKEFRPLAEQGNARAQTVLGLMYANGVGVPQDDTEAVKWFPLAGSQENAQAQYNLGMFYAFGLGVSQDNTEAVKWFRLAAVQGYVKAKNALKSLEATLAQQIKKKSLKAEEAARLEVERVARLKAEEVRGPKKEPQTGEGYSLFGINILPVENPQESER
jgi:TPR repeat protein